ncbi:MAG: lysostaphin resistance A-like protein [Dermatophilaceae bacterium]
MSESTTADLEARPASARRWEALRRHAAPGVRGAGRGLLVGAAPTLLLVLLSPSPLAVARAALAWWTAVIGCAAPLTVLAWWASRRWRATQAPAQVRGGVLVAAVALLTFALGLVVAAGFLTALVGETAAENWNDWLTRVLWLWFIGSMLLLWRSLTPGDLGLGRRMTPTVRRWVVATWVLAIGSGTTFGLAGIGDDVHDQLAQWPLNPLAEELFFRGLLLAVLVRALGEHRSRRGIPTGWAVVLMVAVFGFVHDIDLSHGLTGNAWAGPLFVTDVGGLDGDVVTGLFIRVVSALLYWYLYVSTGSIWPAVAYHAFHNSIGIYELKLTVMLVLTIVLVVLHRRRPREEAAPTPSAAASTPSG